jgi:molecular chaperone DnaJ
MNGKRCYYEVLGIDREASQEEIKRAYRRLAREHHPDVNPGDDGAEDRFKEVAEAYEVLCDENRRAQYNLYGHAGAPGGNDFGFGFGGFSDLFESFFGGFQSSSQSRSQDLRGADLRLDLEMTLEEAAFGTEKKLSITRLANCEVCGGSGGKEGSKSVTCQFCQGRGQVRHNSGAFGLQFTSVAPCGNCQGEGKIISDPCTKCRGEGRIRQTAELSAKIPPGVDSGNRLRLKGEGDAGRRGGSSGDLYLVFHLLPHENFERKGTEIISEAALPFTTAALGGKLKVPTLRGEEEINIPAGTQPGAVFRLRGQGMPNSSGQAVGDHHVIVKISIPTRLSAAQRKLLSEFAAAMGEEPEGDNKGLLNRVKEALGGN